MATNLEGLVNPKIANKVGRAVQTDSTLLHHALEIMEQKKYCKYVVGSKVWPASNCAQQLPTTRNNMQQGVQTDNLTMLTPFAGALHL